MVLRLPARDSSSVDMSEVHNKIAEVDVKHRSTLENVFNELGEARADVFMLSSKVEDLQSIAFEIKSKTEIVEKPVFNVIERTEIIEQPKFDVVVVTESIQKPAYTVTERSETVEKVNVTEVTKTQVLTKNVALITCTMLAIDIVLQVIHFWR
jgi:hypothetical protein